jgi:DNA-directed RNA polymerase subunit M/transcription elongation factor TFIIS
MSSSIQQPNLIPFRTSAVFCSACGMLLPLTSTQTHAECRFCKHVTAIADLVGNEVVTRKELNQRKEWMETAEQRNKYAKGPEKVIVNEDCPECDSKQMYYMTR